MNKYRQYLNNPDYEFIPYNQEERKFAMGGNVPDGMGNAQLELEENTLNPDGTSTQFNLPSHEQQSKDEGTILQPGTLIFSDRLKPKGSKKTFAELNKPNNTNKEDILLQDKNTNNITRLSAELMKKAKLRKSIELFNEQESMKQSKADNYIKRMGGIQKYRNAGVYDPEEPQGAVITDDNGNQILAHKFYNPQGFNDDDQLRNDFIASQDAYNQRGINEYNNIMGNYNMYTPEDQRLLSGGDPIDNTPITSNGIPSNNKGKGNSMNWGNVAMQAGQFIGQNIGNFYDLKRANEVEKETYNRVTPTYIDPSAALRYNRTVARNAAEGIKDASTGDANTYISNRKDLAINSMLTNARIKADYAAQNAQIENQARYYNAGLGDREKIANMQNRAQSRNIKANAISKIGQNSAGQLRDYNYSQRDKESIGYIMAMYPELKNNPEFVKYFNQ